MRFSKQRKQILLVLLRHNSRTLFLSEIMNPILEMKQKKWESTTEEVKLPRSRVLSASLCRSLRVLCARGLVARSESIGRSQWRLTTEGLDTAREIKQQLERQIEELNELKYLFLHGR